MKAGRILRWEPEPMTALRPEVKNPSTRPCQ